MLQSNLGSLGTDFSIPLFFFEGTNDFQTPIEPAHAYFERVKAPRKEFVPFKGGDHFIPFDRPNEIPGAIDRACSTAGRFDADDPVSTRCFVRGRVLRVVDPDRQ